MTDVIARSTPAANSAATSTRGKTPAATVATRGTILYEAHNLTFKGGTGIATYTRALAQAAGRLGYRVDGLFGVERGLSRGQDALNEILAFDAVDDNEWLSPLQVAWRTLNYPFNALGGMRPVELPRSGLVTGPIADALRPFRRAYASTRLIDISMMHFKLYGRAARIKVPERPSIFHATHPVPLAVRGCPNIYTIHDLVPLRLPFATLDRKTVFQALCKDILRTADHIVTVSETTRRDLISLFGVAEERVTTTYQSVRLPRSATDKSDADVERQVSGVFGLPWKDYFLFFGGIEPKKNLARLIEAYLSSGVTTPLVIVGGQGWLSEDETRLLYSDLVEVSTIRQRTIRREDRIRRYDYLPFGLLVSLIRGAKATLFPSLYEGFGLPVLESMQLGVPVLTSTGGALPEIAGDAALLTDPYDANAIEKGIVALDNDADLRAELTARGRTRAEAFSAENHRRRLSAVYDKLA
jgi:glycosyltransferase involved in cell wall biosynthesis